MQRSPHHRQRADEVAEPEHGDEPATATGVSREFPGEQHGGDAECATGRRRRDRGDRDLAQRSRTQQQPRFARPVRCGGLRGRAGDRQRHHRNTGDDDQPRHGHQAHERRHGRRERGHHGRAGGARDAVRHRVDAADPRDVTAQPRDERAEPAGQQRPGGTGRGEGHGRPRGSPTVQQPGAGRERDAVEDTGRGQHPPTVPGAVEQSSGPRAERVRRGERGGEQPAHDRTGAGS